MHVLSAQPVPKRPEKHVRKSVNTRLVANLCSCFTKALVTEADCVCMPPARSINSGTYFQQRSIMGLELHSNRGFDFQKSNRIKTGVLHGDGLDLMKPLSNNSYSRGDSSGGSLGASLSHARAMGAAPGARMI
ncbi:hypothetical protein L1987_80961 [Smallanthus sonchifolius]|uniref:Uncharacterized protein n=1 Tax=Smallanthus sonchifolius TaxID=185202 RepID=A0ACB8YPR3_9ASTR|nr:hypothetical protein L1987_80961 [Smallanthus sonchifolius]